MIYLKTSIGVELRGDDMLIAALQSNFSGGVFTHFKRIGGYRLRNKEDLKRELQHFFRSNRLSKDNILLGIPRKDIVLRHLELPAEVAENIKQVIQYQVQSFEPTEEDKFYYDYILLNGNGNRKKLSVLVAMVRKAFLDELLSFFLAIGIRPVTVTGSSMALSNIFLQKRKDLRGKTFILADLAPSSMELLALRNGSFVYSRETLKESSRSWKSLILGEIEEAVSKIRLGSDATVEQIVLAGESSEGAREEIKGVIPECMLLKETISIDSTGENKVHLQAAAATLGLAYTGMVRRPAIKMNLLPQSLRVHQARWAYVPAGILGLAVVALLAALGFRTMAQNRLLISELDREISKIQGSVEKVQALRNQADALEKKIRSLESLLRKRDMNLEILKEITTVLPSDTFLNMYTNREGTIQISGSSGSASELLPNLEKSALLKDVVQKGGWFKDPQTGKGRFTFEMKLER